MKISKLLNIAIDAALDAGKEVIKVYESGVIIRDLKDDNSPVTKADINSHICINRHLKKTKIPVLSEEAADIPYEVRKNWKLLWMIDPLDGTKEFLKKNGEFTINIALIKNQKPIVGVVYSPAKKILYFAEKGLGSYVVKNFKNKTQIFNESYGLPTVKNKNYYGIIISRSHLDKKTINELKKLKKKNIKTFSIGSSLKICFLAEGIVDYYPRFHPLMEWDIAAAYAILKYSNQNFDTDFTKFNNNNLLIPEISFKTV